MSDLPVVVIRWRDAVTGGGWNEPEKAKERALRPHMVESCGYLFAEDETAIVLMQSIHDYGGAEEEGKVSDYLTIPKSSIARRQTYRP